MTIEEHIAANDHSANELTTSSHMTKISNASKVFHKHGYNSIRLRMKGKKYTKFDKTTGKECELIATGKEAESSWKTWQDKKQTDDVIHDSVVPTGKDKGKVMPGLFSESREDCNLGLVLGDVSGDERVRLRSNRY